MRWDNLLADQPETETAALPLFPAEAVIRRFRTPQFQGMTFYEVGAKSIINHVPGDHFGFNWTINPYRGCSHSCVYCFARPTHTYLDFDAGRDFETRIVVKVNAALQLRRELRRASWKGNLIAMGTNTDPYQRAEGHYRLMRGILQELNDARNPYSILTKGTLIQRDLDLLRQGAAVTSVSANFSVGTVDEAVWKETEPGTPHPMKRLEVVRLLNDSGIPCGVLMAPILPGISDSPAQLRATVQAAADAGATHVTPITLHLRPGVKEEFLPWLAEHHPELMASYASNYKRANAPRSLSEPIGREVAELRQHFGIRQLHAGGRGRPEPASAVQPVPDPAGAAQAGWNPAAAAREGGATPRGAAARGTGGDRAPGIPAPGEDAGGDRAPGIPAPGEDAAREAAPGMPASTQDAAGHDWAGDGAVTSAPAEDKSEGEGQLCFALETSSIRRAPTLRLAPRPRRER